MGNSTINNNHEGVSYLVFAFLFIGLIIQAIAAISFVTTDTFCGVSTSDNSTETLSERVAFGNFQSIALMAVIPEFIAFCIGTSRIKFFAQKFCVPRCGAHWATCFRLGNFWFVPCIITGIMNMTGMIICHMFSTDCALSITGYKYALGNFVFATIKVALYIAFVGKYGFPDPSKFLGSEKNVEDYGMHTVEITTEYRDAKTNAYVRTEKNQVHRLVKKERY